MTTVQGFNEIRPVTSVLYTQSTRVSGSLRSIHWRFSDTLNALDQDFVVLHDATFQSLYAAKGEEVAASSLLLRRDRIILGIPHEAQVGVERSPGRQGLQIQRTPLRALVEAWPFTLEGTLHLPSGVDLLQHVHDPHRMFMPMTAVSVTYQPSPLLSFQSPFLLVNRRSVEVVLDASQVGKRAADDPDVAKPGAVDTELSGVRAAELLAGTSVFKPVNLPQLQEVCAELCERSRMSRRFVRAGVEVFRQGDVGDTLYVVESGKLEVYVTDPRTRENRHLAYFNPGDFFGEMAILGEGRRTATVRAVTDASLLAVHEEAVQLLMRRFPSATTGMLSVMLQRQAGLDAVSRAAGHHA
ncbi:MAG: cyclic nucleotide-binding domain-containing protein [Chloroflexi bacterium]|nr:cyclic nucleotide-binding domain-containing protein [Chloroflexota bacterium]